MIKVPFLIFQNRLNQSWFFSEKATNLSKSPPWFWRYLVASKVKIKMEISSSFMAFSEYMNFFRGTYVLKSLVSFELLHLQQFGTFGSDQFFKNVHTFFHIFKSLYVIVKSIVWYSSSKTRKTQNEHLIIVYQNLIRL